MSCFDTVYHQCECGGQVEWQDKSGPCDLLMLDIGEVSQYPSIAGSLHNEVEYCTECGKAYRIQAMIMVQVVRHNHAEDDE